MLLIGRIGLVWYNLQKIVRRHFQGRPKKQSQGSEMEIGVKL